MIVNHLSHHLFPVNHLFIGFISGCDSFGIIISDVIFAFHPTTCFPSWLVVHYQLHLQSRFIRFTQHLIEGTLDRPTFERIVNPHGRLYRILSQRIAAIFIVERRVLFVHRSRSQSRSQSRSLQVAPSRSRSQSQSLAVEVESLPKSLVVAFTPVLALLAPCCRGSTHVLSILIPRILVDASLL